MTRALAVDIGGTKTAVALVEGATVVARVTLATPARDGPGAVVETVLRGYRRLEEAGALAGGQPPVTGVASAGLVVDGRVTAVSKELLPGWDDYPLAEELTARLGSPATVLNDAQAAAYGEWQYGAGTSVRSLLFVTVSTGVGGGVVVGGRLWRGARGLAGHIGHARTGLLERVSSGTALARRAAEAGRAGVDAKGVMAAVGAGEPWAAQLLDDAAEALAEVLTDVTYLLDPELVVIGGGVGLNGAYRAAVERHFGRTFGRSSGGLPPEARPPLVAGTLGADAGLVGAAAVATAPTRNA